MRISLLALMILTTFAAAHPAFADDTDNQGAAIDIQQPKAEDIMGSDDDKLPGEPKKPCSETLRCDGACPRP